MLDKKNIKVKVPLIIYMFLLLFAPPIVNEINLLLILFVFSSFAILIKYRSEVKEILHNKNIKKIILIVLSYYLWYCCTVLINGIISGKIYLYNYIINIYSMALAIPVLTICCIHIILYSKRHNINLNELIKIIIISGLIQSLFTILCCLFPQFKMGLLEFMYNNTGEKLYLHEYSITRRFFGFANNLLDSFGFGTGIIAILPLFYSIKNSRKWLLTVPVLLLVPLLNSRTGLVVFFLGVFFWILYIIKEKKIKEYSRIFIATIIILAIFVLIISFVFPTTIQWILTDFASFFSNKEGTADVLFGNDFWTLPPLLNIFIGTGYNVAGFGNMSEIIGFNSDVGYINELWKTGIIGIIIQLIMLGFIAKNCFKRATKEYKYFITFLIVAILVANIKFTVFSYNPGIVIMTILALIFMIENTRPKQENDQKQEKELISIIVPIYNVENYLENCLNSILNQTYKNIEIVLVNDGSKDNSEKICKEFASKDNRIKYIIQENQGLSAARNSGIRESSGQYYIFIDSDDYVNIHFVEELYNTLIKTNADIAICDYKKVYENKILDINCEENGMIEVYEGRGKFSNLYNNKSVITTVAWNKIYKKYLFNNIKYPVGKIHEDEYIIFDILNEAKKVAYTSCEYYYYLQRKNSITGNYKINRITILEGLYNRLENFRKQGEKKLYAKTLYNYYYQLIYHFKMIEKYFPERKDIINSLYEEITKHKKEVLLNIYIDPLRKLKLMFKLCGIK